ncbi:hypothetical protein Tco_1121573 [Tanacetum coccineum]|uniref:Uncharacterized protein n=1 Tax=Tanacetum coccineum TaxID=301880 RepID=A0ABQ5J0R2_9ASTR
MTPRSCLRWKPTGKIFKTVGLKWIPTGKILTSSTTKVDSEPSNGSNDDIINQYDAKTKTLDVSAGSLGIDNISYLEMLIKYRHGRGVRMPTKIELNTGTIKNKGVSNDSGIHKIEHGDAFIPAGVGFIITAHAQIY